MLKNIKKRGDSFSVIISKEMSTSMNVDNRPVGKQGKINELVKA